MLWSAQDSQNSPPSSSLGDGRQHIVYLGPPGHRLRGWGLSRQDIVSIRAGSQARALVLIERGRRGWGVLWAGCGAGRRVGGWGAGGRGWLGGSGGARGRGGP